MMGRQKDTAAKEELDRIIQEQHEVSEKIVTLFCSSIVL